jgi:hypothetical protein
MVLHQYLYCLPHTNFQELHTLQLTVWEPEFSFFRFKTQTSTKTGSLKFGNK